MVKACVVTASRAEYGLLRPLLLAMKADPFFDLQLVVTGMHLSDAFGKTGQAIADDGFTIDAQVEILDTDDSAQGTLHAMARAIAGFAEALLRLAPDFIVLLGDRYEIFCVAAAATVLQIPIVHLHGGEITEGAFDDAFRHCITKMSLLHFTATEEYRRRVIQLGEAPERVFNVGAIGLDNIRDLALLDRDEIAAQLGLDASRPYYLVTYHPQTLGQGDALAEVDALVQALLDRPGSQSVITKANADTGGRSINARLEEWAARYPQRLRLFTSLGQQRYLSALKHAAAVVGNSSSGIIEAPGMGLPTLDIGDRQRGRLRAANVRNVAPTREAIAAGLEMLPPPSSLSADPLYGAGGTAPKIAAILAAWPWDAQTLKTFHDMPVG